MSTIVTTIVSTIANTYPNRKLIGYRYRYQIMDLLPNLISSIVMGIGVYFLGLIQIDKLVVMIIEIVSGIAIYYAIGLISKNRNLRFLLDIVGQYSAGIRKREKGGSGQCGNGSQKAAATLAVRSYGTAERGKPALRVFCFEGAESGAGAL